MWTVVYCCECDGPVSDSGCCTKPFPVPFMSKLVININHCGVKWDQKSTHSFTKQFSRVNQKCWCFSPGPASLRC